MSGSYTPEEEKTTTTAYRTSKATCKSSCTRTTKLNPASAER